MGTQVSLKGYVVLTIRIYPEGKQWVSECVELGTASCGDTIEEAFENIKDATILYLNTIETSGQRDRIFKQRGIKVHSGEPPPVAALDHLEAKPNELISPYMPPLPTPAGAR